LRAEKCKQSEEGISNNYWEAGILVVAGSKPKCAGCLLNKYFNSAGQSYAT
jgi:hypothetical protein